MLLAQRLQQAGITFISARARHRPDGMRIDEIVCATADDVARVNEWAARERFTAQARLATPDEVAENAKWSEG